MLSPGLATLKESCENATPDYGPSSVGLLCERRTARLETITRVVEECGARLYDAGSLEAVGGEEHREGRIVLVALDEGPEACAALAGQIGALRGVGLTVVCYGDGVRLWPLGRRCQLLLAGALDILDSGQAEFPQELARTLTRLVSAETYRRAEDEKIKGVMKRLGVAGQSREMLAVFRWVVRVAALSDLPALVTGETGTGKEVLVNALHRLDEKRCRGPFVALNCSAINPNLAESELFGHRRGAFTGAEAGRKGLIRSAEGGVLFLDEVGDLDPQLQAKLLRVIQERRVLGVGDDREVDVSVRVVAATNRDLEELVRQGKFREDLFHRLNMLSIHLPPLRQRKDDIGPLVEHFLDKHRPPGRDGQPLSAGPEFIDALKLMRLPGNARELEHLVARVVGDRETAEPLRLLDLPADAWRELAVAESPAQTSEANVAAEVNEAPPASPEELRAQLARVLDEHGWNLTRSLEYCERLLLESALQRADGNQTQTARLLGITARSVYNKVRKHNLH
ncbi:MAG TPA: sigma 54-interacting transcriptional regulator [Pyrinomonadaceae bacterium]